MMMVMVIVLFKQLWKLTISFKIARHNREAALSDKKKDVGDVKNLKKKKKEKEIKSSSNGHSIKLYQKVYMVVTGEPPKRARGCNTRTDFGRKGYLVGTPDELKSAISESFSV
ncbi:hypothetical protein AAHE18_10G165400 [Arachis hypogaea]|nr:uncharacterized protein LOC112716141 isoform X1 [Arachis hypogaea]XP_025623788.1 uncharacterized protein LOC112716141 isoform X1 [Arachis hypogaea]XP_025623789.1 uncharacterized protein LOC112716141 isoform X1 [Arachis hypogaea]XP_025623790.1 uncharacterized protein LOC112716141 isoform X1 [Arachis hypogaea]QHO16832.1 uncharacterized protein DS421_10g306980 [Arachis hypogaea]